MPQRAVTIAGPNTDRIDLRAGLRRARCSDRERAAARTLLTVEEHVALIRCADGDVARTEETAREATAEVELAVMFAMPSVIARPRS